MRSDSLAVAALAWVLVACAPAPVAPVGAASPPTVQTGSAPLAPSAAAPSASPSPPGSGSAGTPVAPASSSPAPAPVAVTPAPPPPALQEALDAAGKAIAAGDAATADKQLAVATAAAGEDAHLAYLVARVRATRFAHVGRLRARGRRAGRRDPGARPASRAPRRVLVAQRDDDDPRGAGRPRRGAGRERPGDPLRGARHLGPARPRHARLPERPLAPRLSHADARRVARRLGEAGARRSTRRPRSTSTAPRGFPDSVAVLDAYFAALDGKRDEAPSPPRSVSTPRRTTTSKTSTSWSWASRRGAIAPPPRPYAA